MADIELVIKIPDHLYKLLKDFPSDSNETTIENVLMKAVENGTPIPKGHGKIIDADALKMDTRVCGDRYLSKTSLFVANKVIEQANTIIEADTESEVRNELFATDKAKQYR